MKANLTIEFHGLCAFVRPAARQAPLHVVCVDGSHPGHCGQHVAAMPRHSAWLTADVRRVDADIEPRAVAMVKGRRFGLWELTGYDITLKSRGADFGSSPKLPNEAPKAAVMKDITGDGRIAKAYTAHYQHRPAPFATRIALMGGSVRYRRPIGYLQTSWEFKPALPGRKAHVQKLTNVIAYDLGAPSGRVDLLLRRVAVKNERHRLRLTCADDSVVSISNLPFAEDPAADSWKASHFEAFYGLLHAGVNVFPIPTRRPSGGAGVAHGQFCVPALFDPPKARP